MDTLKTKKYKYVQNMLSDDMLEFLSSFSVKKTVEGTNYFIDDFVEKSSSFHSKESEIYNHILHFLLPVMEKETNLKLKPIYSFNRIYLPGSKLKKHTDREACEISASITLKYNYKDKDYKWPLCVGDTPIIIKSGDGVIYKGCEIEHWRPVFLQPDGCWHHQLFIHYVDKNGPYKNLMEEKTQKELDKNINEGLGFKS